MRRASVELLVVGSELAAEQLVGDRHEELVVHDDGRAEHVVPELGRYAITWASNLYGYWVCLDE